MQPTPLPPHRPGSGNPGRAPCGSSKKLAMQRKGLHRANSRRPHTRPSEVHAGCSDDSPIALRLIAPMRLYSRRSDRTVIGRGGSRCSAHEDGSEGGVPESTSRSMMSSRHSAGVAQQVVQGPSSREPGGAGAGLFGLTTPHQSPGLAEAGCQPGLSELGSSVPSQQPALTHGSCAPSLMRLLLRYRLPNLRVGWGGGESLRPGSGSSSRSKGEAVGSRRRRVGGRLVSRGGGSRAGRRGGGIGTYQLGLLCASAGEMLLLGGRDGLWASGRVENS